MGIINSLLVSFIVLFFAVDAVGILPEFISLTGDLKRTGRKRLLQDSLVTAGVIGFAFMFLGGIIFWILGVSIPDFKIAGGILLMVFSLKFLFTPGEVKRKSVSENAILPFATPLIAGPAVLISLLLLMDACGLIVTMISFALNMGIAYLIFERSRIIAKFLGVNGMTALSKVVDIMLCAFAVMMIRKGIMAIFFN